MSNAGMSGFVSFLEHPAPVQGKQGFEMEPGAKAGTVGATAAIPQPYPVAPADDERRRLTDDEKRSSAERTSRVPRGRQGRIRRATMVEDGHSLAEQAVY